VEVPVVPRDKEQARKVTWDKTRRLVLARDGEKCLRCLGEATDVHHRRPKGMGGTGNSYIKYGLANLVSLCRECHQWVHNNPSEAYRLGFLVHSGFDPACIPIILKMLVVKLTPDGDIVRSGEHALF
jgi:hypothetical protein